jgi:hypothetical protein
MYRNAKAEMVRAGLRLEDIAPQIGTKGISVGTLSQKLNEKFPFTLNEAKDFKRIVKSELPLEVLFESFEEASQCV